MPSDFNNLGNVLAQIKARAAQLVNEGGKEDIEQPIHESFDGPKSGEIYGSHQASAPGEPPAKQSETLDKSVETVASGEYTVDVIADTDYAGILEDPEGLNRQFMHPAAEDAKEKIAERARNLFRDLG